MTDNKVPPILADKHYDQATVFEPVNLLREARRQRGITSSEPVPAICLLDPDGDIVRRLEADGRARPHRGWACYHTRLHTAEFDGLELGIVACAVGAAFAVLVAEQLFASGCRLLLSITSSGQLHPVGPTPYFVLIESARRDEGTSYHYLPPADYSHAPAPILAALEGAFDRLHMPVHRGRTWTTDAPFRETAPAIERMSGLGLLAVEMEAAALYAFARARLRAVICFAHVTNRMGQLEGDFEKGEREGTRDALALILRAARCLTREWS